MKANRYRIIAVLGAAVLLFALWQTAIADPPEKPGNPGVPGLLAEIAGLKAQIAELEAIIQGYEDFAPVAQTGQTESFAEGDDGALEMGVPLPEPRFTDNGDGTVTDNLTKLVWLKNADRFGLLTWEAALIACNSLQDDDVELTDGSISGDWRLPNIRELQSLLDYGYWIPCLSNALGTGKYVDGNPFVGVSLYGGGGGDNNYWSSTSNPEGSGLGLDFVDGQVRIMGKGDHTHYVWPVRNAN